MGEYSVKAILSAVDKNFSSTMKSALGCTNNLKGTLTSGIGFGVMMAIGQRAFSAVTNSAAGLISEIDSSNAAWKTFSSNMEMVGKNAGEITGIKKELQAFAEQTIYSSSDMAATFSQLEAVGTKNTTKLVKGFGGLAAAAENPQQAMKTLSQQATQMAAKPTVAWMDFKLMLEQTPAGIAAVAKQMGKTTSQLVKDVQAGKISTEEFFDAISEVGTNDAFTKLATSYKTAGQAMDGLQETVANKLTPSFDILSGVAISSISGIIDKIGEIDGAALASKVSGFVTNAGKYWQVFKADFIEVKNAFGDAAGAIIGEVGKITGAFGSTESVRGFSDVLGIATGALTTFAGFCEKHADVIAKVITVLPKLYVAYKGFQIVRTVAPFVGAFTSAVGGLTKLGLSKLAPNLFGVAKGQDAVGKSSGRSSKKMLASAKAFMMLGVGVLAISAGFYLLAQSAVAVADAGPLAVGVLVGLVGTVTALSVGMIKMLSTMSGGTKKLAVMSTAMLALGASILLISAGFWVLSDAAVRLAGAGPLAIGVMVGMVAAVALLAAGAAVLGPALTAGAVGFIAFGAAIVLVAVGALLASAALAVVAGVLPILAEYGLSGALAIAALGASMVVFAAGAAVCGVACIALGAGLTVVAVGLTLVGAAVLITAAGVLILAAGMLVLGAGFAVVAASAVIMAGAFPIIAVGAVASATAFTALLAVMAALGAGFVVMTASMTVFGAGALVATAGVVAFGVAMTAGCVGVVAMAVSLKAVNSSMKSIASNAKMAQSSMKNMCSSMNVVNSGLDAIGNKAKSAMKSLTGAFDNAASKAVSSGQKVGSGFNIGLSAGCIQAVATARSTSNSVSSAFGSARNSAYNSGVYIGAGLASGIRSQVGAVRSAAAQLASAADAAIRAKARIHSPSKVSMKEGQYWGQGWINGILSKAREAWRAAEELVQMPDIGSPDLRMSFAGSYGNADLSEEYSYSSNATYTIIVPVEIEGREVARVSAVYTKEELDQMEKFNNYRKGYR